MTLVFRHRPSIFFGLGQVATSEAQSSWSVCPGTQAVCSSLCGLSLRSVPWIRFFLPPEGLVRLHPWLRTAPGVCSVKLNFNILLESPGSSANYCLLPSANAHPLPRTSCSSLFLDFYD